MKERIASTRLGESYEKILHPSGLEILLYPMEGFETAYALFATKYGSVDTTFKTQHETDFVTVPEGIAHFLEHKMFENEDGTDTFARYAATGASANAYTTFDHTAYLFSCTDHFRESLEILLDFVTAPYFTPESVAKEQGIIGQEITMYLDDPDWRVMFNLFTGLYEKNPVRIDIAGTIDSIAQIDDQLLYRCYHTFYNLHNMVLVLAGNFSPEEALAAADKILKPAPPMEIQRRVPEEPAGVNQPLVEQTFAVSLPQFYFGYKHQPASEGEEYFHSFTHDILLEAIVGEASPLYRRLYDSGLINSTFSYGSFSKRGFAMLLFSGESRNPEQVAEAIRQEVAHYQAEGIPTEAFDAAKKTVYGSQIGSYSSATGVGSTLLSAYLAGKNGYDALEHIAAVTLEDVEQALVTHLDPTLSALSLVKGS